MSLVKQSMTEKNHAAHQANGQKSRGAATPEGKERTRAAHMRHGFYSQQREEALQALGEDPAELAALIADTQAELQPDSDFQARISERMARLWWRMERAERIQQSLMVQQKQAQAQAREDAATELRRLHNPKVDILHLLAQTPADPRYYTPRGYFQMFSEAFGDKPEDRQKEILVLMHRLRKPRGGVRNTGNGTRDKGYGIRDTGELGGNSDSLSNPNCETPTPNPGVTGAVGTNPETRIPNPASLDPSPESPTPDPEARPDPPDDTYVDDLKEMDAEDFPIPWPKTPIATGTERDEAREELCDVAQNLLGMVNRFLDPKIEEHERPRSLTEQDEGLAAPHPHAELMRREEESCFRQFMRLGNYLHKVQTRAEKRARNGGSSGYVDENTQGEETDVMTECPAVAVGPAPPSPASATISAPTASATAGTKPDAEKPRSVVGGRTSEPGGHASEAGTRTSKVREAGSVEVQKAVARVPRLDSTFKIQHSR